MRRLIGQTRVEAFLARAAARDRVAHAYLFLGPSGTGKSTAARLFAMAINCTGESPDDGSLAPCGECESCRRIEANTHPEVLEVLPGSKTRQNITVEQAREIRKNAALRPKLGKRRVYLIPHAEAFNEESANALLKTLEEPSPFITLILCAPNPSQVLPTIRSRCQVVRFGLAPISEVEEMLTAEGSTPETARSLARASGGRPGLALAWAREPRILKTRRGVMDLFAQAVSLQREAARDPSAGARSLRLAEQLRGMVTKESDDTEAARPPKALHAQNLDTGLTYLRDLLVLTESAGPELVRNQERIDELISLARGMDHQRLLEAIRAVREAQQLLDRNVAPQLVLERMFWALIAGPPPARDRLFAPVEL